jgi:outer membrane protein OmpA-like peptidoglycan-associated protein
MTVTSHQKLLLSGLVLALLTSGCGWIHWRDKEPARDASSIDSAGADVTFANDQKKARDDAAKSSDAAKAGGAQADAAATTPLPGGSDQNTGSGGEMVKDGDGAKVSPMKDPPAEIDAATEKMQGADSGAGDQMAGKDGAAAEKVTLQGDALFQFGKADEKSMLPGGKQRLDELADKIMAMEKDTIAGITIVGHADRLGSPSGNMKISEKRAATVMNYLVRRGVDTGMLESVGKGDADPITDCPGDKANKALQACLSPNRRVEVIINTK